MICRECGAYLTAEERHYYETGCEKCERAWTDRITAWRHGEIDDPELDKLYGRQEVKH